MIQWKRKQPFHQQADDWSFEYESICVCRGVGRFFWAWLDTPRALGWNEPTGVGFNSPGHDAQDESACQAFSTHPLIAAAPPAVGRRSDDFGVLSLSEDSPGPSSSSAHPPSLPSSLPIYAPVSRSPLSLDESCIPLSAHRLQHSQWHIIFILAVLRLSQ